MKISDYTYFLPEDKIAKYPLPKRDTSKLLVYKEQKILHATFLALDEHLPGNAFLFFNNTRVIPARIHFKKESGATIEVFLLNPTLPSSLLTIAMATQRSCTWQCTIGNLKKWPTEISLIKKVGDTTLVATMKDRAKNEVEFTWDSDLLFADVIREAGETPLPPYIHRKPEVNDRERYQTIYSSLDGAVAAPTAGLHFTPEIFQKLKNRNIGHDFLTLHVSAGTFLPVKTENPDDHVMHEEQIIISRENIANVLTPGRLITAVGTTSMRTLESLYWFGAKLLLNPKSTFTINQHDPYEWPNPPTFETSMRAIQEHMDRNQVDHLIGRTSILIRPGYDFKVCRALITNFHQPGSTLILLVAAFVGEDWKKIYQAAVNDDYRFLSYGDSSLLIPATTDAAVNTPFGRNGK